MRPLLFVVALFTLGFAPAPFPRARQPAQTDLEKMQGTWEEVELYYEGGSFRCQANVTGKIWAMQTVVNDEPERPLKCQITLDVTSTPRAIDLHDSNYADGYLRGIYFFPNRNVLVFCYRQGRNAARPAAFTEQSRACVVVFRRVW